MIRFHGRWRTASPLVAALALAGVTIFVARPLAVALVLRKASISRGARAFIGWFGPRGLASLLLAILVIQAELPGAETILALAGVVVTVSVVLHGVTATPLASWYARRLAAGTLDEERSSTAGTLLRGSDGDPDAVPRVEAGELVRRLAGPSPPIVLDVRSRSSYDKDPEGIPGGVRVPPDDVEQWARRRQRDEAVVAYCT